MKTIIQSKKSKRFSIKLLKVNFKNHWFLINNLDASHLHYVLIDICVERKMREHETYSIMLQIRILYMKITKISDISNKYFSRK
jgi:hypothetical protein